MSQINCVIRVRPGTDVVADTEAVGDAPALTADGAVISRPEPVDGIVIVPWEQLGSHGARTALALGAARLEILR